jgi:signal transduction histidine kinase
MSITSSFSSDLPPVAETVTAQSLLDLLTTRLPLLLRTATPLDLVDQTGQRIGALLATQHHALGQIQARFSAHVWASVATHEAPDTRSRALEIVSRFAAGCADGLVHVQHIGKPSPREAAPILVLPPIDLQAVQRTVLDTTSTLIMVLDGLGRVVVFNRACERVTGVAAETILGGYLWDVGLIPDDALHYVPQILAGNLDHLPTHYVNVWNESALGMCRIAWTVQVVRGVDAASSAIVCTGTDTTEPWLTDAALRDARRRLAAQHDTAQLRLARDLHDGPLQDLYQLQIAHTTLEHDDPTRLVEALTMIDTVIAALRMHCTDLRPLALQQVGVAAAIESHLLTLRAAYPQVIVRPVLQPDCPTLADDVQLHLYRIYQAAVTNVLRHAHAQTLTVRFEWDAEAVVLELADDGVGCVLPEDWNALRLAGHYGLIGIWERADICGGRVTLATAPGQGMRVRVTLPGIRAPEREDACP